MFQIPSFKVLRHKEIRYIGSVTFSTAGSFDTNERVFIIRKRKREEGGKGRLAC